MNLNSIWQTHKIRHFDPQTDTIKCDVLVVGAGLCGLMCAYELTENGISGDRIVIIDANRVCSATSARSTAKLTAQHGLIYDRLINKFGAERASQYAAANARTVKRAFEIAQNIDAKQHIMPMPSYVYAVNDKQMKSIESEAKAARALGFEADITVETTLPFNVEGALRFDSQAVINPVGFAAALTENLCNKGCSIYEHTKALYPEKNAVVTDKGKIFAEKIIISTRFPFADKRGLYFIKLYQQRSYMLAVKCKEKVDSSFVCAENSGLSFRPYKDYLIICGTADKKGKLYNGYSDLIFRAKELYPDLSIVKKWSAEDCITHDAIAYIGKDKSLGSEYFIATGFNKWGISTSFVAADIIKDIILKGYSPYEDIFSPKRSVITSGVKSLVKHSAEIASEFISDATSVPVKKSEDLAVGESAVAAKGVKKTCACRDKDGLHELNHRCTHMGCPLKWNMDEQVWDCSCHGSRFDSHGKVISGPAKNDLNEI